MEPKKISREVCRNRDYEKNWSLICFFIGKFAFFSKVCVFNNLLGPIEVHSKLAQYFSKDLLDAYRLFLDI